MTQTREVRRFFDDHADGYRHRQAGMQHLHAVSASRIEATIDGVVLGLGGLWAGASPGATSARIVIADLSYAMLAPWSRGETWAVQCDALALPIAPGSCDHVVCSLTLHHVAGTTFKEARAAVGRILAGAATVLKPDGRLWISELCPSPLVYRFEQWLTPVTRLGLRALGEPLVMMHSAEFYLELLRKQGWQSVIADRIESPEVGAMDWVWPVIAAPWLRIPRALFPLRPILIQASRPLC
jgi:SAM-dependent methyltransferase